MKHNIKPKVMKGEIKNPKTEILNKTFYDCRLEDYFTVLNDESNNENFVYIEYKNKTHRNKKEAVAFIIYHIDAKQYLPKIV